MEAVYGKGSLLRPQPEKLQDLATLDGKGQTCWDITAVFSWSKWQLELHWLGCSSQVTGVQISGDNYCPAVYKNDKWGSGETLVLFQFVSKADSVSPLRWLPETHQHFPAQWTGKFLSVPFSSGTFILICSHSLHNEQAFTMCLEEVLFFIKCKCL